MTATVNKASRRYAREQQQEDRSEAQFKERLAEVGWPCDRLGRDLGEDLHVRIYDDEASTGLSFYVQLKSAATAEGLKRKKTPALGYKLEIKDLLHWEVSATLVVLVVWDVKERTGWWRPIPEIIKDLDATTKGWRKQKTVAVSVPLANGTDEEGLNRLRWAVANHNRPIVPKPNQMEYALVFESTDDGKAAMQAFEKALDMGDSIVFEHGFVPRVEYPIWHQRLYGKDLFVRPTRVELRPAVEHKLKAIRIEIDSPEGPAVFPYIELRSVKHGRKRFVLTNEHQGLPLVFAFDLSEDKPSIGFHQTRFGGTPYEARETAAFMLAAGVPGSVMRVVDPRDGRMLLSFQGPQPSLNYDVEQMRHRLKIFDELCFIQQQVARYGALSLAGIEEISSEEIETIESLSRIFRDGRIEVLKSISFSLEPTAGEIPEYECSVRLDVGGVQVKLFNLDIPLGDIRATILESTRFIEAMRDARAKAIATGEPVPVHLPKLAILEEYLDWLPSKSAPWGVVYNEAFDRLSGAAVLHDGYFTRADALTAGVTDEIHDALLRERKIELCASGVFRLVHFPRSDHEDLIVLWLQTDRKGVISHDTALLLHDLSDILPRRRHITVPPGWEPGDRQLDSNVVLHHAAIGEDEIRWLGPVPYTAPLRTLRDCIASHLSPDLIEQAVDDGLRRGMFTEAELPEGARRGVA